MGLIDKEVLESLYKNWYNKLIKWVNCIIASCKN